MNFKINYIKIIKYIYLAYIAYIFISSIYKKDGRSLPPRVAPDHTIVEKRITQSRVQSKRVDPRSEWNGIRKLDEIVNSGAYEKSDFKPTMRSDLI